MTPEAEFLVQTFTTNRHRHGKVWRKIRRDRVSKLLSWIEDIEIVEQIISECLTHGKLEACRVQSQFQGTTWQEPALKLVKFQYNGKA